MEIPFLRAKAVRFKSKDDRERMGERKECAKNVRSPFDNKRPTSRAQAAKKVPVPGNRLK